MDSGCLIEYSLARRLELGARVEEEEEGEEIGADGAMVKG